MLTVCNYRLLLFASSVISSVTQVRQSQFLIISWNYWRQLASCQLSAENYRRIDQPNFNWDSSFLTRDKQLKQHDRYRCKRYGGDKFHHLFTYVLVNLPEDYHVDTSYHVDISNYWFTIEGSQTSAHSRHYPLVEISGVKHVDVINHVDLIWFDFSLHT
jgi:hypothetical protein